MYRNAHVQRTRWDAQNDRMDQRQKEWNDRKMCAWLVNECMNGTKCEMSKTSPWRALLERVLSTLFYMDYGEKPRTHHAHMHPVCSGTSSQSWRSGDITRKLGHFNVISPNQKIKKKKKKTSLPLLKGAFRRTSPLIHPAQGTPSLNMSKDYCTTAGTGGRFPPKIPNAWGEKQTWDGWPLSCKHRRLTPPIPYFGWSKSKSGFFCNHQCFGSELTWR